MIPDGSGRIRFTESGLFSLASSCFLEGLTHKMHFVPNILHLGDFCMVVSELYDILKQALGLFDQIAKER